jgi:hypothetical protein
MDADDIFDDDFEIEDAALVGGFLGMVEEEDEEERKRRKLEKETLDLDDADRERDDEEDV